MASQQVVIRLVGENDQLRKSLQQSQRQMKRLEKQVNQFKKGGRGSFKPMAESAGMAAGATIAAAKAFDFLKGSVKTTEELTKASAKLSNVTGSDVSTSAQWVQLAKARGIGTKQLTTGFVSLSKQVTAAQKGTGKAAAAFDTLGVSQKTLASGNTTAILSEVSDGLARVQNPAERAALAQQLLGRSGKDLMGVLKGGSGELKTQLGIYKGSSDEIARNKDSVLKLAGNQRKLTQAVDSVRISIGVALIPVLEKVTTVLTKFSNLSPGMKRAIMTLIGIGAAVVAINKVKNAFVALKIVMMANPFIAVATIAITAAILIWQNWDKVKKWLGQAWTWIKTKFVELGNTIRSWAQKGFLGPVAWIITNWGKIVEFFKALPGKIGAFLSRVRAKAKEVADAIVSKIKDGVVAAKNWVSNKFNDIVNFARGLANRVKNGAKNAGNALWGGIKSGARGIVNWAKGIINGVIGTLESGVNRVIRGMNKGIKNFNKIPGIPDIGTIGEVSFPRLAEGGIVNRPTLALIGEAGPEAVVPLSGRNARKAGVVGGGNTFNITNINGALDEQQLARSIGWQLASRGLA